MADYTQFNLRGDTKSNWLNANPVLSDREIALETDTQRFKIGNGTSYYNQLPYGRNTGEYLNFYNVTALAPLTVGNYYTHETAILAVPSSERVKGTIVSYETASGVWYTERFIGSNVSNWSVLANWEKVPDASDIAQLRSDLNEIEQDQIQGGVYDVSYHNDGAVFESLSTLLGSADLNTLIPTSVRRGGMSIRFIQGSVSNYDNKYAQYRLTANEWNTDTDDWAISDESVYAEDSEFIKVVLDNEDKVLYGVKINGDFYFGAGVPSQVQEVAANKVDKKEGESLIDVDYASSQSAIENHEYIQVTTDSEDKILEGITSNGVKNINIPVATPSVTIHSIENPEYIQVTTDSDGKILEGFTSDGKKVINCGLNINGSLYVNEKKISSNSIFCSIENYKNLVSNNYWDAAFTAALNENEIVYIPKGEYNVQNSIVLPNNITIFAEADAKIYRAVQQESITHENCRVLYAENKSNITIIGGCWDSKTKVIGSLVREHSCRGALSFFRCNRLTILNCSIKCFTGSFCIQPGSCSNMVISNIYFDNAEGCGVQVGGNTHNFDISNLSGSCHDDMVALNGYDWWTSSAEIGTIQCGKVHNLYPNSATAAVRVNVGIANKDGQTYVGIVKDIIIENIYGTYSRVNAVHIGTEKDEYGSRSPLAYADNITVRNVNCQPIDGIENQPIRLFGNIGTLILDNISDSHIRGLLTTNENANVKMLVIKNCKAYSNNSLYINGHIQRLILDNIQKTEESQQSFALVSGEYGIIDDVILKNSYIQSGFSVISVMNTSSLYKAKYTNCYIANVRLVCNYNNNIQTVLLLDNADLQNIVTSEGNFLIKNSVYQ